MWSRERIFFVLIVISMLGSACLYGYYYGEAESIVCYRTHLADHPYQDAYHMFRLIDKLGLIIFGSSLSFYIMWMRKYSDYWFEYVFFFIFLLASAFCGYFYFNLGFDGTGEYLYKLDESWEFSTGCQFLDEILGFKW